MSPRNLRFSAAGLPGFVLLPSTALATLVGMFAYLAWSGAFQHAGRRRFGPVSLPWPGRWTWIAWACSAWGRSYRIC